MRNYRKTPNVRPYARQLDLGDLLTTRQAACIDRTRLRDFGLAIIEEHNGARVIRD